MRENRLSGSEGGAGQCPAPTPIEHGVEDREASSEALQRLARRTRTPEPPHALKRMTTNAESKIERLVVRRFSASSVEPVHQSRPMR
jgi:hypothetical protein